MTSCVSYEEIKPFDGLVLPRRTGYTTGVTNDWLYFNLETGQSFNAEGVGQDIREGEQYDRLDWDLAFCGYTLRTNSGSSGIGQGGAVDLGEVDYESIERLSQLPKDAAWVVDNRDVWVTISRNDWNKYLIEHQLDFNANPWFDPNSGPQKVKTSANPLLSQAIRFLGPPPKYIPSGHVYVVRSADGAHYYKLKLLSWYHSGVEIGDEGGRISYYCKELLKD